MIKFAIFELSMPPNSNENHDLEKEIKFQRSCSSSGSERRYIGKPEPERRCVTGSSGHRDKTKETWSKIIMTVSHGMVLIEFENTEPRVNEIRHSSLFDTFISHLKKITFVN